MLFVVKLFLTIKSFSRKYLRDCRLHALNGEPVRGKAGFSRARWQRRLIRLCKRDRRTYKHTQRKRARKHTDTTTLAPASYVPKLHYDTSTRKPKNEHRYTGTCSYVHLRYHSHIHTSSAQSQEHTHPLTPTRPHPLLSHQHTDT